MSRESKNLFVYGTLRRFQRERIKLVQFDIPEYRKKAYVRTYTILENSPCLGMAKTQGFLYDVGSYPAMISGDGTVHGEVYNINLEKLKIIDLFEGYEEQKPSLSHYIRISVPIFSGKDESTEAEVYLYNHSVNGMVLIKSGDYFEYLNSKRT